MPCTSDPDISSVAINHIHILMKSSFPLFLSLSILHASNVRHLYSQQIFMIVSFFIHSFLPYFFLFAISTKRIWCILSVQKRPLQREIKLVEKSKPSPPQCKAMRCNAMNGNNRHKMKLEISRKIIKPTLLIHIQTFLSPILSPVCCFIFCMVRGQCSYRLIDEL